MTNIPFVSIIVPCYNEELFVAGLMASVAEQDYGLDNFELLMIDGMSKDKTVDLIKSHSSAFKYISIFTNSKKTVPFAMNEGIKQSKGSVIVRLDAHASYPSNYVSQLVKYLFELKADNVGGVWHTEPFEKTLKAKSISLALSTPFGVGNSMFRIGVNEPTETDTVPFGCYHKEVFDKIGLYDERLERNQDIELNKRLKRAGGKIYLIPDVYSVYYSRGTFGKLIDNNYKNGLWVILTAYYTKALDSLSLRHYIPLLFLLYMLFLPPLALLTKIAIIPFIFYMLFLILVSIKIAISNSNILIAPYVIISIFLLHLSYGFGSLVGLFKMMNYAVVKNGK